MENNSKTKIQFKSMMIIKIQRSVLILSSVVKKKVLLNSGYLTCHVTYVVLHKGSMKIMTGLQNGLNRTFRKFSRAFQASQSKALKTVTFKRALKIHALLCESIISKTFFPKTDDSSFHPRGKFQKKIN